MQFSSFENHSVQKYSIQTVSNVFFNHSVVTVKTTTMFIVIIINDFLFDLEMLINIQVLLLNIVVNIITAS